MPRGSAQSQPSPVATAVKVGELQMVYRNLYLMCHHRAKNTSKDTMQGQFHPEEINSLYFLFPAATSLGPSPQPEPSLHVMSAPASNEQIPSNWQPWLSNQTKPVSNASPVSQASWGL
jgi:hypothetical protein